jgi:NNP family nitrate/nitrite transporter-like MFS transporter
MPTVKKPKCAKADSEICKACLIKFPGENMKYAGQKDTAEAPKGAKDAECKVCYPYEGRVKGRAGCGGLGLTDYQVQVSTLVAISGTVILRVLIGPISDGIGIRYAYTILLILSSVPGFLLASSTGYAPIVIFRFIVGFAGASFVLTQLWTTQMFDLNCVGIANATSAGWGNLGGGISQMLNSAVFASCKKSGMKNDTAWRVTCAWSPGVIFCLGVLVFLLADDTPYGQLGDLRKKNKNEADQAAAANDEAAAQKAALEAGGEPGSVAAKSLIDAACNWQTWILHLCYMFSFGVELIVNGNIVSYFVTTFGMTQSDAGLFGSIFGFLNFFARSFGGWMSDIFVEMEFNGKKWGPRGRLWALFIQTTLMGICLTSFSSLTRDGNGIGSMIANLVFWGFFTNMTEGGTFAVVPYVLPSAIGGVAGIVGAGGNAGAMLGNAMAVVLRGRTKAARMCMFCGLGWGALASSMLIPCLWIPGIGSMFREATVAPLPVDVEKQGQVAMPTGPTPSFIPVNPAPQQMQQVQQFQVVPPPQLPQVGAFTPAAGGI